MGFPMENVFQPCPNKQAIEVRFSNKRDQENYLPLQLSSTDVRKADSQKHLGLILDSKLNFNKHIENKNTKCNKIIEMVQYNVTLIITGAFKGTSRDNMYQEFGLESLADRRSTRKLFFCTK